MKTLSEVFKKYEAVIGLEIHTELTSLDTKMFCSCKNSSTDPVNQNVCPVCLGMPGALPVPNKDAIRSIVLAGLATNCDIEKNSMFYRKNYFYPDMSKNYQITQGLVAFCMRGHLDLDVPTKAAQERVDIDKEEDGSYIAHIGITRIHMEEDAGKLNHIGGVDGRIAGADHSLIDYNRCGVPLIELVTEPDLRTPEEARLFMQKLREIFLTIKISDCSMEQGSMRCDGNVSLRKRGAKEFGVKTELKNMNSFKNLHDGLEYEIIRQANVLEEGGQVYQETRHWEPSNKRTVVMRTKETADDYRLFPDPDLAPYDLSDEFIDSVREFLPELPDQKRDRYIADYGLSKQDASELAGSLEQSSFFEEALGDKKEIAKSLANIILNNLAGYLNAEGLSISESKISAESISELAELLSSDEISSKQAKDVFAIMIEEDELPRVIVEERGMKQVSDKGAIVELVKEVIAKSPDQVQQYKDGNQKIIGYLVGQAMKASKGQGNPKLINQTLREELDKL